MTEIDRQKLESQEPLTEDELRGMLGEPVWCVYEGGASWFIVHESLFTILNGLTAYRHKLSDFGEINKIAQMTNGDRIRVMSDFDLADMMTNLNAGFTCWECTDGGKEKCPGDCTGRCLFWLQQPAEEAKDNA